MYDEWRKLMNKLEQYKQPYGLLPSPPDPRDFRYKVFAGAQPLPPAFSRKDEMPPVRDQGPYGTCVGFATWAIKEWQERQQNDTPQSGLSPRFIYQMAKQLDGVPGVPGTYPRVALKVVQDYGDCPEQVFPYNELKADRNLPKPDPCIIEAAKPYKVSAYARLYSLEEVKRAIVEQGPVLLAVIVTDSFVKAKDFIPQPSNDVYGGHAIVACGYDDNVKLGPYTGGVLMMNSWGTSWAQKGFCWIPYQAWNWRIDSDTPFIVEAWACVDLPFTPKMAKHILLKIGNKTAFVDGEYVQLDVPPKIENDRTLLPVRFVAEQAGYIVNWQPTNRIVELRRPW
ncbi:stalk domain-containing protein [Caldanaerobius polysaccharolyticus]|uniref:stalk domain-containing protein n=1 Tax=Caldanaerobius polysaccharolyticus TaxID=44256 RepID=UPI00047B223E|nr:stalk domain-containing protein [Caldanaerobius polysaccharolyticus]